MTRPVETALYFWNHRSIPPKNVIPFVQNLEASGAVDHFWMWDVIAGWFPPDVWTEEFTPLAAFGDFDSVYDAWVTLGLAASATDKLGMLLGGTNGLRHGPAELLQRAMTLADSTEGGSICCIGAGEAYNTIPFGYKRNKAIGRVEDHLRIIRTLWETNGPITFEGNEINFDNAYIGNVRGRRPEFWAMGAGPRLQRIAGDYADGWMTVVPNGITNPDQYAECVKAMKQRVEMAGRDPEKFRFGLTPPVLLNEDPDIIERVFDNNIIKFFCSIFGRVEQSNWAELGIESPFPPGWNYSLSFLPMKFHREELFGALNRTSKEAVQACWTSGSPKEVAVKLQDYIDAGADLIAPYDLLPAGLSDLSQMESSLLGQIELCRHLKEANPGSESRLTVTATGSLSGLRHADYSLSQEQRELRDAFGAMLSRECTAARVRAAEPAGFDEDLWKALRQMGALSMGLPEAVGGDGAGLVELALVAEQIGRHLAPVPFVEAIVAARALAGHNALSPQMVAGDHIVVPALHDVRHPQLVPAGAIARSVVGVSADTFRVAKLRQPLQQARNQANAPLGLGTPAALGAGTVLCHSERADLASRRMRSEWMLLTAAAQVGIADAALRLGIDYANQRVAFGVAIGTFQAVAHALVDCHIVVIGARRLVWKAAWFAQHEPDAAPELLPMAFAYAARAAARATTVGVHTQGGLGVTTESDMQLYFRRAKGWANVMGDPGNALDGVADALYGPAA